MVARRPFPAKVKREALKRAEGRCEECTFMPHLGKLHYDHITPDALGGEPTLENCRVLCVMCHRDKTGKRDIPMIAKADRLYKKHNGAAKPKGRPMLGSKASGWKHEMNGRWVRR